MASFPIKDSQEHVGHDRPGVATVDGAAKSEDFTGEEPPNETDGVLALVVGGDGNVDELEGSVGVAKRDDRDVDIGSLTDGLDVDSGVGNNDQTGLLEGLGDVVSEVAWGEAAGNGHGTGLGGELEDSAVAVRASRDNANIGRVLNSSDDTGSEDELLPSLGEVDHVDACKRQSGQACYWKSVTAEATYHRLYACRHSQSSACRSSWYRCGIGPTFWREQAHRSQRCSEFLKQIEHD